MVVVYASGVEGLDDVFSEEAGAACDDDALVFPVEGVGIGHVGGSGFDLKGMIGVVLGGFG